MGERDLNEDPCSGAWTLEAIHVRFVQNIYVNVDLCGLRTDITDLDRPDLDQSQDLGTAIYNLLSKQLF